MMTSEAAAILNEEQQRVRVQAPDWDRLAQEGAIVSLHVGRYRGRAALTMRDLGIGNQDAETNAAMAKLVQLGARLLLPRRVIDELMRLDTLSRNTLRRHSIQTTWGFFVPRKAYTAWSKENKQVRDSYLAYAKWVAENWDDLTREVYDGYIALGFANYRRLREAGALDEDIDRDEWVKNFARRATASTPTAETFLSLVVYDWETCYVPFANSQGTELPGEARDAMERDMRATMARKAQEDISKFVSEIQGGIQQRVVEVTEGCLRVLRDDGALTRGSSMALKNLVETVDKLKFWPDEALDKKLAEISDLMAVRADKRENVELRAVLFNLNREAKIVLDSIGRPAERGDDPRAVSFDDIETPKRKRDDARRLNEIAIEMFNEVDAEDIDAPAERELLDVSLG